MQGERVKQVRSYFHLTLEKFGDKLGVTKVAISNIEKGNRNLTTQMAKAICKQFNVDYIWLTTGKGDMFLEEDEEVELMHYLEEILNTSPNLKNALIKFSKVAKMQDLERLDEIIKEMCQKDKKPEQ